MLCKGEELATCDFSAMPLGVCLALEAAEPAWPVSLSGDPFAHITTESCQSLFVEVVTRAWTDAIDPDLSVRAGERLAALRWFGTPDYFTICALAGVDADNLLVAFKSARRRLGQAA